MLFNGCSSIAGSFCLTPMVLPVKPYVRSSGHLALPVKPYVSLSRLSAHFRSSRVRNSQGLSLERNPRCLRGNLSHKLSASSTPLLRPSLPTRGKPLMPPKAVKDFRSLAMTEKPKWWWRTLASLPYIIPLHKPWEYAAAAYPFLENLDFLTDHYLLTVGRLPMLFPLVYSYVAYTYIIKRKDCPHFFRFHVMMGMMMELGLQVMETVSRLIPLHVLCGKMGMHFWAAMTLAYMLVLLECIRCALYGTYPNIPFFRDAVLMHTSYK